MAPRNYPGVRRLWYIDRHGVKRQTATYFIRYCHRGKRFREKTGLTSAKAAYDLLLQRRQEARTGRLIGPKSERITIAVLEQLVVDNYASKGRRTPEATVRRRFKPLHEYFREAKAMDIGFTIAVKSKLLPEAPEFPRLKLDNARKVIIDRPTLASLMKHLPEDLRPVFEVGLLTGWRKEAILSRERRHADLSGRWLHLDGRWSKNGESVTVDMIRPLRAICLRQERKARHLERATGRIIPWLFFYSESKGNCRAGDQIRDISHAFDVARKAAGVPHVHFHDLRRGAIRLMRSAGASEHEIMDWVGIKTRSVFDRYDHIDEDRRRATGTRLEAYYEEEGRKRPIVAAFRKT